MGICIIFSTIFIALFTAIQFIGGEYTNIIFVVVIVIYFGLQINYKPFAYNRVNRVEVTCLVLLIIAFIAATFVDETIKDDGVYVSIILSFCIIIPIIIILWHIYHIYNYRKRVQKFNMEHVRRDARLTQKMRYDVERLMERQPKSFRDTLRKGTTQIFGEPKDEDEIMELEMATVNKPQKQTGTLNNNNDMIGEDNDDDTGIELVLEGGNESNDDVAGTRIEITTDEMNNNEAGDRDNYKETNVDEIVKSADLVQASKGNQTAEEMEMMESLFQTK